MYPRKAVTPWQSAEKLTEKTTIGRAELINNVVSRGERAGDAVPPVNSR